MALRDLIGGTRAVRAFSEQPIDDELASRILDAGRLAQSGANLQPWHFVAIRQRETLQALASQGDFAGHLAGAALGVLIVMPLDDAGGWNWFDCGQAAAYMQLTATELGIGSCIAAITNLPETQRLLGIPPEFKATIAISFGYPADPQIRAPQRGGRRTLADVVHWERW